VLDLLGSGIDPAFMMPSDYSHLNGYARQKYVIDFDLDDSTAPVEQTRLLVESVALKDWLDNRLIRPPVLGKIAEKQIRSVVGGGPFAGSPMWNSKEMFENSKRRVVPTLYQRV